ncbi:MAG: hypothetical protein GX135_07325 [Candidatus Cloacimonetes bacterium]|nr:hypothetical protein [Candidatus Cloacimonadota bacterium]
MISIFIDYKLARFQHEIKYAFSFIFQTLGYGFCFISDTGQLKDNDILIIYTYSEPTVEELKGIARHFITIFIQSEPDLFDPSAMDPEKLRKSLRTIKLLSQTPVLSTRNFSFPAENYSETQVHAGKINFDLVGNIFFHLAALEPQIDPTRDAEGCHPDSASVFHAYRDTPFVDNLLWLIDSMIKEHSRAKGIRLAQKQYWPQAQEGAALLSHSVDNLQKWNYASLFLSVGSDLAMLFSFAWRQLFHGLGTKLRFLFTNVELYWNFEEYRQLEQEAGFRSVYYIAPEKNEYINYSLDDTDLQEEIRHLGRAGHEVALLLSPDKATRDDFVSRKQIMLHQLRKDQIGIRQLDFKVNDSLRDLHNRMAPAYSQSTARKETPGFISGVSVPYQPWIGGLKSDWWELPTTYRNSQLRLGRYKTLQLESAKQLLKKYLQTTLRTQGVFGLELDMACYADIPYVKKLYAYALALLNAARVWVPTASELASWWEKRTRVTIEESDHEISVYFPDEMEHFALQILNEDKIREVDGLPARVEGNMVHFSDVPAEAIAVIRLNREP